MAFSITKSAGSFITPGHPTPPGLLPLSSIDRVFIPGLFVETIHIFKNGQEPVKTIREALAKTLVPYYPIAGRLVKSPDPTGDLHVSCTGEGLWFVEATANCTLDDANWLQDHPPLIPTSHLLPSPPCPNLTIMIQVTTFTCGGFVVALLFDHTVADGLGVAQFINAVSEFARGEKKLSIEPVWCRDLIPNPPITPPGAPLSLPNFHNKYFSIDIAASLIHRYKKQISQRCSTFDILCAMIWHCRARAIKLDPHTDLYLNFSASARDLVGLPRGFYGNCVQLVTISASSEKISGGSVVEIVELIREAKEKMPMEFEKWVAGDFKVDEAKLGFSYKSMNVADWSRLGFGEVDYGWGKAAYVAPLMNVDFTPTCFFVKQIAPMEGVRVITQCVKEEHLVAFRDEMVKLVV